MEVIIIFLKALMLLIILSVINDLVTYRIKNALLVIFVAIGLILNGRLMGLHGLYQSLCGMAIPLLLLIPLYLIKALGAGDIKLFAAVGCIMGAEFITYAIIYSFLLGGVFAFLIMLGRKNLKERCDYFVTYAKSCMLTLAILPYHYQWRKDDHDRFHFSFAIAAGIFLELFLYYHGVLEWGRLTWQRLSL